VDEDIGDLGDGLADGVFDFVGDSVALYDGDGAIDFYVEVHVVFEAHFADAALLGFLDALDGEGGVADLLLDVFWRGGVHEVGDRGPEDEEAVVGDDGAGKEGGPVVGSLESLATDEGDGDADEGGGGGDGICAVMHGVGFHGHAAGGSRELSDAAGMDFFYDDDYEQDG